MATVTGLTADRMLAIESATVIGGHIDGSDHLILEKYDGTTVDTGALPPGPSGPPGPAGGMIPGEIRMWPGAVLPDVGLFGAWAWCDGAVYLVASYPSTAAAIDPAWRTFDGAGDPGVLNFRVPDMRGLVPAGLDQMPGGVRANRMARAVAIVIAGKTGEESHVITIPEMPSHNHTINDPKHRHNVAHIAGAQGAAGSGGIYGASSGLSDDEYTGITINNNGGNGSHNNIQPSVMIPYIVKMD